MAGNINLAVDNTAEYLNDAEVIGTETPDFRAMLDREATFLTGEMWGQRDRRNTQDGDWKATTLTWGNWIGGQEGTKNAPAWGLSRHPVSKNKTGSAIVLGSSVGGARKAKAMDTMFAVGLDIDSGTTYDAMVKKLEELDRFALVSTTYNHGKRGIELKRDDVLRKLGLSRDPSDEEVRDYLRRCDKNRYEEFFIDGTTIKEQKHQTAEGVKIVLDTPPLDKMRVIFPLAEPVKLIELADTQTECLTIWEDKVTGLARNVLGVHFDVSCTDVSRLFFTARHPKDGVWDCAIVQGDPLSFEDIPAMEKAAYTRERVSGGSNVHHYTESGVDLNSWYAEHAERFQIADLLETLCPDKVRGPASSVTGVVIECPFEASHSSEGGSGTIAINALDAHGERGTIKCSHDSCQGRKNAEFLAGMLAQGWFTEEELFDTETGFILEAGEELTEEAASPADEFEPVTDWLPKRFKLKGKTIYTMQDDEDTPVCQAFDVVGRSSNADGTDNAGRILSFKNENGKQVEVTIARADIAGDGNAVVRELAGKGLLIYGRGKKASDRLLDLLNEISPKRQIPTVNVPGFVRNEHGEIAGFMHPNGVYDRVSGPPVRLLEGSRIEVVKTKGTLEGWRSGAIEALSYADTNFYWPLGLISGFAGPVLGILEWPPCGFSLSGYTSKGKTLAQLKGATIWGSPKAGRGLLFTANTTNNAMEDLAARGTDAFLGMDEIGAMSDKRALASILFALSTGRTKSRKSGPGRGLTEGDNFRPFAVLSSEQGMKNEIAGAGDKYRGGLAVRFPDIDVSEGKTLEDPAELARLEAIKDHYGHAGPVFIRHLIDSGVAFDRTKLEREVLAIASRLAEGKGGAMARAARVFAVAQRAGELAADAALLGDPDTAKKAIQNAVQRAWDVFTTSDEAGAANGGEALLDTLRSFLFGELNRHIVVMDSLPEVSDGHANARGDVLGWADSDVIYLDSSKIKDPSVLGVDIGKREELLRQLKERGVLIEPGGKGNTFRQLPKELAEGAGEEGAAVRNIRLCRKALGI